LIAIYVSFLRQLRPVAPRHKALFLALLLFIVIRGLADAERFDLSFPLWAIALISLMLADRAHALTPPVSPEATP
jgi:exopolysaccharide production protein ExoQ